MWMVRCRNWRWSDRWSDIVAGIRLRIVELRRQSMMSGYPQPCSHKISI